MSSDSAKEEDERFRESVDIVLFKDEFFCETRKQDVQEPSTKFSLRPFFQNNEHNQLKVTSEYQHYCAKQLSKFLESRIKEVSGIKINLKKRRKKYRGGVRLLGSSLCYLSCQDDVPDTNNLRCKGKSKRKPSDSLTEEQKCIEAAVPAEWLLSQRAVSGWEPNRKGKLVVLEADV